MKRTKRKPRLQSRGGPVQYFDYGPWRFNINRAMALAGNTTRYQPEQQRPTPDWIGPSIDIDFDHALRCDLRRPVIAATIVQDRRPWRLLIDGNHRVARALTTGEAVQVVTLNLEDTLKTLTAPPGMVERMRRQGEALGLLPSTPVAT